MATAEQVFKALTEGSSAVAALTAQELGSLLGEDGGPLRRALLRLYDSDKRVHRRLRPGNYINPPFEYWFQSTPRTTDVKSPVAEQAQASLRAGREEAESARRQRSTHTPTACVRSLLRTKPIVRITEAEQLAKAHLGEKGARNMASAVAALVQKGEAYRARINGELCVYVPGTALPPGSFDYGASMFRNHSPHSPAVAAAAKHAPASLPARAPAPSAPLPGGPALELRVPFRGDYLYLTFAEAKALRAALAVLA